MSKVFRKSLIAVFACLLAVTSIFGFATLPTFNPSAEEESGFYLEKGASIRIEDDGYIGIKYTTVVKQQWYRDVIKDYQNAKVSFGSFVSIADTNKNVEDITGAVAVDENYNEVKDICHVSNDSTDKSTSQLIGFSNGVMTYSTTIIFNVGKVYTELRELNNGVAPTQEELKAEMLKRFYKKIILPRSYIKIEVQGSDPVYEYAINNDNARSVLVIADNYLSMYNNNDQDSSSIKLPENYADNFFGVIREYPNAGIGTDRIIKGYNFNSNNSSYASNGVSLVLEDSDKSSVKLPESEMEGLDNGESYKLTVFNANGDVDRLTIKRGDFAITTVEELKDAILIDEDYDGSKYYVLATDLDMAGVEYKHTHMDGYYSTSNDNWNKYDVNSNKGFTGTFDGNGHTIYNFDATQSPTGVNAEGETKSAGMNVGLFGVVYDGTIKNLALYNVKADESVYMCVFSSSTAKFENIYVKVSDDTYAPKGFFYVSPYGGGSYFENIIIQYNRELKSNGKYSSAAIGKKYGVWNGRMTGIDAESKNIYIISPSMVTFTGSGDDMNCLTGQRYASNEVYLNINLQKPVYDKDGTTIIGGEKIRITENSLLKKQNAVGFWNEETKTFTFVNDIPHNNNGYVNSKVTTFKRFNNIEEFMADEATQELGSLGEYWDVINGIPLWKSLDVTANTQILVGDVSLTKDNNIQVNSFTIDTENVDYELSLNDNFGKPITAFTVETSHDILKVDGNKLYVEEMELMPVKVYVTIFAEIYGREVKKEIIVNVHNPINTNYSQNEYLYSELDNELRIADLGLTNISNIWYKDANGNLQELKYNTETGELTGITTTTTFIGASYSRSFSGLNVDLTFTDESTTSITLEAKNGALADSISLLIRSGDDGDLYELNNVKPVYKAIDEESELNMSLYFDEEKYNHSAVQVNQVKQKYFMLASSLTSEGVYTGEKVNEATWYINGCVIDGNGNYLKDFVIQKSETDTSKVSYGLFGGYLNGSSMSNLAIYNLTVNNGSALHNYVYGSSFNNMFIDINEYSTKYSGIVKANWPELAIAFKNVLINCPVSEENASYVVGYGSSLKALGDSGEKAENFYVVSKLPITTLTSTRITGDDELTKANTYYLDAFNQKPDNATEAMQRIEVKENNVVTGYTDGTRKVYVNEERTTLYYEKFNVKRYNSFVEFKSATNDYSGFTNENGSGCWVTSGGVPIWKDYYEVMGAERTIFTFTEGDNTYEGNFTITKVNTEYTISATLLGSDVEIVDITSNNEAITIDKENLTIKVANAPTELLYAELSFTFKVVEDSEPVTKTVNINVGYPETVVEETLFYSEDDGEIIGIKDYIGEKNIVSAYYIDAEGNKVKLATSEGKFSGISVIPEQSANYYHHVTKLVGSVVGTIDGEPTTRNFELSSNVATAGATIKKTIKLYLFCDGACYVLNNVIPTTKVVDDISELDLNYDSDSTQEYSQGYVVLGSNIDGSTDETGLSAPTAELSKDFIFDGRGYTIKNIKLAEGNTTGIFAKTSSKNTFGSHANMYGSLFNNFALVDVKADNSTLLGDNFAYTTISNAYIKVSPETNVYKGLTNSSWSYNGVRMHFIAVYYEYLPVYTEENIGALDETLIGSERPYVVDDTSTENVDEGEYFLTSGTLACDAFRGATAFHSTTFVGNGIAGKFAFGNDDLLKNVPINLFNKPNTEYVFAQHTLDAPILWADKPQVTAVQEARITAGTSPVGTVLKGTEVPMSFYKNMGANKHTFATAFLNNYCHMDLVKSTEDELVMYSVESTEGKSVNANFEINGTKWSKYSEYFTSQATVMYPTMNASEIATYTSVGDAKTKNEAKYYNTLWWNVETMENDKGEIVPSNNTLNTWENA